MAYRPRGSQSSLEPIKRENGYKPWNTPIPLSVLPLNCIPPSEYAPTSAETDFSSSEGQPAMLFFTSCPSKEEWNDIIAASKSGVAFTGSAALGQVGPAIGAVDIAESFDEYLFRVSLPGVARDDTSFACDVDPDGKVVIKGVKSTGERTVCKNSMVFKMQTQNLGPPGAFSISFQLPGPVLYQNLITAFTDGILEGLVKKRL